MTRGGMPTARLAVSAAHEWLLLWDLLSPQGGGDGVIVVFVVVVVIVRVLKKMKRRQLIEMERTNLGEVLDLCPAPRRLLFY